MRPGNLCIFSFTLSLLFPLLLASQEDLLDLLDAGNNQTQFVSASFKTNRVINLHSLENTPSGVLDFKISHRFGFINTGISDFFGLDNATIRLGFDYGISDLVTIGIGRSSFEKTYDSFFKYKLMRQSTGLRNIPISAALLVSAAAHGRKSLDPNIEYSFTDRLAYTYQLILGRKFSKNFSLQIVPTMVHRNLVKDRNQANDVYALGAGSRFKLSNRVSLNLEYIYLLPDQISSSFKNSLSVGFDIETGGHVFQLHFTNSTAMIEKGFVAENTGDWGNGGVHFGFNVSRVFTLASPKGF